MKLNIKGNQPFKIYSDTEVLNLLGMENETLSSQQKMLKKLVKTPWLRRDLMDINMENKMKNKEN